jgi:hypothetical protein
MGKDKRPEGRSGRSKHALPPSAIKDALKHASDRDLIDEALRRGLITKAHHASTPGDKTTADRATMRLREHKPGTLSGLIRAICGLKPLRKSMETPAAGAESRRLTIIVRLMPEERRAADRFLKTYLRQRDLTAQVKSRLSHRTAPLTPSQLVRAVIGQGTQQGNRNAAKRSRKQGIAK